jgi:hypothetical protein
MGGWKPCDAGIPLGVGKGRNLNNVIVDAIETSKVHHHTWSFEYDKTAREHHDTMASRVKN